jgi:hypothetical protein
LFQILCLIVRASGVPAHIITLLAQKITGLANESLDLRFEARCLRGVWHALPIPMH